jgi:hypothetical protein
MTHLLVIMALGLVTWVFYTWLTENAVIAGILMSGTLMLAGLGASARLLVSRLLV